MSRLHHSLVLSWNRITQVCSSPHPVSPLKRSAEDSFTPSNSHRQSVDWYAGLAADQSHPSASRESGLDSTQEEDEPNTNGDAPEINVSNGDVDDLSEFDLSKCDFLSIIMAT